MPAHILVINDDQGILELFQLILEPEGYRVTLSKIAFENVQDIEQIAPDLVVLDFRLRTPEDGLLLLQKLRMYRPTKDIPVIVCTAAVDVMLDQEGTLLEKGIPILYKPFDVDELLTLLTKTLPCALSS